MHALIIDDSRTMRIILDRILTGLGFSTAEAGNGQEALDAIAYGPVPDLCLIDWNMPVMDGYTFVTRVRANAEHRNITLMMVTTESSHGHLVKALADRKSTRLNSVTNAHLVCRLLLEKKNNITTL